MRHRLPTLLTAAALLLALLAGAFPARAEEAPPGQPAAPGAPQGAAESEAERRLLPLGRTAPDFTLPLLGGGEVTLDTLLKLGKAVLVGFWAIDEKRGGADMEKLQKLHRELEGKGLTVITVNPADPADDIAEFLEEKELQLQVAVDGKETNRAVTGVFRARTLPTFYLLDPSGKVLWRSIGLKEPSLREALAKAGVK
jgi:peroxiredoxin